MQLIISSLYKLGVMIYDDKNHWDYRQKFQTIGS